MFTIVTIPNEPTFGDKHYLAVKIKNTKDSALKLMEISRQERNFSGGRFEKFSETVNTNMVVLSVQPLDIEILITWLSIFTKSYWFFNVNPSDLHVWHFYFKNKKDAILFKLKWS